MIKLILSIWVKVILGVVGLSYLISFKIEAFSPHLTKEYIVSTLVTGLVFAVAMAIIQRSKSDSTTDQQNN